ncbi:hypothetical protein [uncultured Cohaesibacter sp.]|uniref:hypothetical protein n=1 Tax=uncultured Cohaesibacter sp. TaxID=1002546 RepID=UPI0029C6612E|nr:hypothetical protein [uncultured Cohaesibacter sp.]
MTVGFHDYDPRISRVLTFGSGMGHHSDHPRSYRPTAIAFWFIVGPVAIALSGYLPGKRLLLGADLPAGVYWQWRRWCTHKSFFNGDIGKALPQPSYAKTVENVKICVAKDDVVVPPTAVRRYASFLAQGGVSYVELDPSGLRVFLLLGISKALAKAMKACGQTFWI